MKSWTQFTHVQLYLGKFIQDNQPTRMCKRTHNRCTEMLFILNEVDEYCCMWIICFIKVDIKVANYDEFAGGGRMIVHVLEEFLKEVRH